MSYSGLGAEPEVVTRVASQGNATYTSTAQLAGYGAAALGVVAAIGIGTALYFGRGRAGSKSMEVALVARRQRGRRRR